MNESDSANIFSSYSDEKLRIALNEINALDSPTIVLLKQEFLNRDMFEESFSIDTFLSETFDPTKLSLKEIQELVSERLHTGESIESIKLDLADHGITLESIIKNEGKRLDTVFDKISSAPYIGKDENALNEELKKEYNYTDEDLVQVKKNLKERSVFYKILGVCIILLSVVHFSIALWLLNLISILSAISLSAIGIGLYSNGIRLSRK